MLRYVNEGAEAESRITLQGHAYAWSPCADAACFILRRSNSHLGPPPPTSLAARSTCVRTVRHSAGRTRKGRRHGYRAGAACNHRDVRQCVRGSTSRERVNAKMAKRQTLAPVHCVVAEHPTPNLANQGSTPPANAVLELGTETCRTRDPIVIMSGALRSQSTRAANAPQHPPGRWPQGRQGAHSAWRGGARTRAETLRGKGVRLRRRNHAADAHPPAQAPPNGCKR